MAVVAEFISVLRKIRDVIYPEINELYDNSLELKELIDVGKIELDESLGQFNIDYQDFNVKKDEVDAQVLSATNSATSAGSSATTATNKSNEIKAITAQSVTGAPGTSASASYNPTDGKFNFIIPQGSKGDKGESFTVNSSGVTESRALYDGQITGWSFLDVTTSLLYFKISSTSGDWSTGFPFGKGDKGVAGDTGVGIVSFTFIETTDLSGLPSKSGATDTYRVTLTNNSTFDYQVYNGLDYSQELLDSKINKDINSLTNKTTPIDADELVIADSTSSFSLKKLSFSNLKDNIVEVGTTRLVPVSTVPTGYLEMNGALLSRTAYSKLFAYLGTTYGAGDGSTTFALPDTRGEFIRGWDNGRGVDSGRTIGSWQVDLFKSHTHTYTRYESTTDRNSGTVSVLSGALTQNTGSTGGTETRPRNIAMMYCIKY